MLSSLMNMSDNTSSIFVAEFADKVAQIRLFLWEINASIQEVVLEFLVLIIDGLEFIVSNGIH